MTRLSKYAGWVLFIYAVALPASDAEPAAKSRDSRGGAARTPIAIQAEASFAAVSASAPAPEAVSRKTNTQPHLRPAIDQPHDEVSLKPGTARGVFVIKAGSRFPVGLLTPIDTSIDKSGKPVCAMLASPLSLGGVTLAEAGSVVRGWLTLSVPERRAIEAKVPSRNWLNASAALSMHFSEIQCADGTLIAISGGPSPGSIIQSEDTKLPLAVNKSGLIVVPYNSLKHAVTAVAIEGAGMATGPLKIITGPVLSSSVAAIEPAYGLDRPVPHVNDSTRLHAMMMGAVKGLPGGFFIAGFKNHGLNFKIPAGTLVLVELESDAVIDAAVHVSAIGAPD